MESAAKKMEREKMIEEARLAVNRHKRNMILKRVGIWGGAIVLLGAMVWGLANLASAPVQVASSGTLSEPIDSTDHTQGAADAKVVLVEYSDFQCPACYQFYPVMRSLVSKYGKDVKFVYRNFPLPQHDKSNLAARAAEAAAVQGKFWEMHDKLFEGQPVWTAKSDVQAEAIFTGYAADLGLNKDKFAADLKAASIETRIERDITSGNSSNVDATPSFYINGKKVTNLQNYGDLESDLTGALSESK